MKKPVTAHVGPGIDAPMIALAPLIALKIKMGRLKDLADVVELLKAGSIPDRNEVARLLKSLGEQPDSYDRLFERASKEPP